MLKKMLNEATITFQIEATGPILIKDGETDEEMRVRKQIDKSSPNMRFVVDANEEIFIPGSSIKGVWRSWCEKIARTISEDNSPLSCDPFDDEITSRHLSCSKRLEKKDSSSIYALSCPICKLFGNTSLGSRIRILDAYLSDNGNKTRDNLSMRDGIGIDRFTGGVSSGANFKYQYVMGRTFKTEVQIRNFELWQLGLLAFLFRDFEEELVPVGFGKTRGLGRVKGTVDSLNLIYYGLNKPQVDKYTNRTEIPGVGNLYNDNDKDNYCFADELPLNDVEFTKCNEDNPIKLILKFDATQARSLFDKTAPYWAGGEGDGYYLKIQSIRENIIQKKIDEGIDV